MTPLHRLYDVQVALEAFTCLLCAQPDVSSVRSKFWAHVITEQNEKSADVVCEPHKSIQFDEFAKK